MLPAKSTLTDVSINESLPCFVRQLGVDHASGEGDVISQVLHVHEGVLPVLSALVVERDQMGAQPPVKLLVLGVQHQEDKVKPEEGRRRGEGRRDGGMRRGGKGEGRRDGGMRGGEMGE